ncbi:MAG: UDP-3-O-[3-hydroxymyristoyl] N-acetylglucosamine deacetylase [Candidatus Omnitrophota bacterium]|nr:MAG: UDP-3-O-[3-hydroxymyristoyl] N-acetylglucosamine deacetylase [Candidatus Omnitrophota bacterium]
MKQQKTINKSFFLEGNGLQTGKSVKAFFYPDKEDSGITFVRRDLENKPRIRLGDLMNLATDRRSKIGDYLETVEHILAALWGAEVDNIRIELTSSEPPGLDGSAGIFLEALKEAGIKIQKPQREFIEIKEPLWVENKESFLGIFPSQTFKISYILEYPGPAIGRQFFSDTVDSKVFQKEIAPARTFCLKEEVDFLLKQGYGKGANLKNTLVMTKDGPMDNILKFPDEPVRHKVLDLIGDLYLLGKPIKGRVIAIRSGHKLNLELVEKIKPVADRRQTGR